MFAATKRLDKINYLINFYKLMAILFVVVFHARDIIPGGGGI